jgi:hypothetical protein
MSMALVKIDPEFETHIAPLTKAEFDQLEENIRREGCRDPLRVWNTLLLDGHNRYHICKKWDIPFGTTPIELPDREAALLWIDENQLGRRNLNDSQRGLIAGRVANGRAEISRRERAAKAGKSGGNGRGKKESSSVNAVCSELNVGQRSPRIDEEVAAKSNVPLRKVKAGQKLDKAAQKSEEGKQLAKQVQDGKMTLAKAVRVLDQDQDAPAKPFRQSNPSPEESQTTPKRRMTRKAFNRCIEHVFNITLYAVAQILSTIDIQAGPLEVSADRREQYLETGRTLTQQLSVLMRRLQRCELIETKDGN